MDLDTSSVILKLFDLETDKKVRRGLGGGRNGKRRKGVGGVDV